MIGFDTLLDRVGTGRPPVGTDFFDVAGYGWNGGVGTAAAARRAAVPQMVEAASDGMAPPGHAAASTTLPGPGCEYRAITFGPPGAIAPGAEQAGPIREAVAACRGCGSLLHVAVIGYLDLVRLIEAAGGQHTARPVEQVWCPSCLGDLIESGGPDQVGVGVGIAPAGPAAQHAGGSARPGPVPGTWGRDDGRARELGEDR